MFYHSLPSSKVLSTLESSATGLSQEEAVLRLKIYGPNAIPEGKRIFWWQRLVKKSTDVLVILLVVAAILSYAIGATLDAWVIFSIALINIGIGFFQETKAEHALAALKKRIVASAKVKRAGLLTTLRSEELVPGDIIVLEAGDKVPADARLLKTAQLKTDESALTGESNAALKDAMAVLPDDVSMGDQSTMVFKGTVVVHGRAEAVVVVTGLNTQIGQVSALLLHAPEKKTPLQEELNRLGFHLTIFACAAAGIVFAALILLQSLRLSDAFFTAISLAVAVVPEGMPTVVTTVLALSVTVMARQKATVRNLTAVETLGSTTAILTDKTGTLTENKMTVTDIISEQPQWLLEAAILCSDAQKIDDGTYVGDPTEICLLEAAEKQGISVEVVRNSYERVYEIPFSSDTKRMVVVVKSPDGKYLAIAKGATESICAGIDCGTQPYTKTDELATKGTRMLAFSTKNLGTPSDHLASFTEEEVVKNHVYLGLIGMRDPVRKEVIAAIAAARGAGIETIMITGDHKLIAKSIALELGMIPGDKAIMEGSMVQKMNDAELAAALGFVRVFARVSPVDKLRIVEAAQATGHVVAVTGDGVNDAPAIKTANIGIAMGRTGTDVAREVADIVLEDDNYATIVDSIRQGRTIMHNFGKFLRYQISCNLSGVLFILTSLLMGLPSPLLPIHILLLNLGSETAPSIALGLEPPEGHIMNMKPRPRSRPIISSRRWGNIFFEAVLLTVTAVAGYGVALVLDPESAQTAAFMTAFLSRLWHAYNCRSDRHSLFSRHVGKNIFLTLTILGTLLIAFLFVYVPIANQLFATRPLSLSLLGAILPLSLLPLVGVELRKYFLPPPKEALVSESDSQGR